MMNLFDTIGQKFKDDPDLKDRLTIGLQGMTMNPNQGLIDLAKGNIAQRQKQGLINQQANKTIEFLRAKGVDEATLKSLEGNPQMLMAYASQLMKSQLSSPTEQPSKVREYEFAKQQGYQGSYEDFLQMGKSSSVTGGLSVDPITGQQYIVRGGQRVNIEGANQLTREEIAKLETKEKLRFADMQKAQEQAALAMQQAGSIQSKLPLYEGIIRNIDEGADTGFIMSKLPVLNEATASLRSAANQLGITVINSATFGALSEKELALALSTEIPQNLGPKELRVYVQNKYQAQAKLANAIRGKARTLSQSGMTYSEYIRQNTAQDIPTTISSADLNDY
jgi:uncharacterized protein (DUF1330 family)